MSQLGNFTTFKEMEEVKELGYFGLLIPYELFVLGMVTHHMHVLRQMLQ